MYLQVSFRRPPAARRVQRFVRRLVAVDARLDVRRGFLACAPARLKNSMISAAGFFANSFAWASRIFLTISTARISAVCFTRYNLSRRIDRQGLIATFYIDGVKQPNLVEPDDVAEVPADQNVNIRNGCECDMKHVVLKLRPKDLSLKICTADPSIRSRLEAVRLRRRSTLHAPLGPVRGPVLGSMPPITESLASKACPQNALRFGCRM